jgi:Hsp90 protein
MKAKQDWIHYIAAANRTEAESSPFIVARGYEVLVLVEAFDEYSTALPEDSSCPSLRMRKPKNSPTLRVFSLSACLDELTENTRRYKIWGFSAGPILQKYFKNFSNKRDRKQNDFC